MYQFLWIFFIYAFLGWCTEVSYAALNTGKFVNRGFLNGPVCPIYGFGVVIVLACLTPLKGNFILLFLGSVVLTSALEWLTGFVLEKLFHQRWWDYSDKPFNLSGYICLQFSIAWGFACLFVVDILHPSIEFLIRLMPHTLGWVLLVLFGAVMAVDLAATVRTIAKINRQLSQIDEMAARIKAASNEFGENLADRVLDAAEKGADLRENLDDWMDDLAERREDLEESLAERKAEFREDLEDWKDNLADRREDLEESLAERKAEFQEDLEDWKENLVQRKAQRRAAREADLAELRDKLQDLLDGETFGQRRLLTAFPKMRSTDHTQALDRMRRRMELRRKSR